MVINIFLKNNLAASLHIALFPSSPVTDLDKDKPASRLLFIFFLTQMEKKQFPTTLLLSFRKCKYGSYGLGKRLPRDVPVGGLLTCWPLTLDPCNPRNHCSLMSACHGQTIEKNLVGSQGGKRPKLLFGLWWCLEESIFMPIPPMPLGGADTIILKAEPQVVVHLNLQQSFLLRLTFF